MPPSYLCGRRWSTVRPRPWSSFFAGASETLRVVLILFHPAEGSLLPLYPSCLPLLCTSLPQALTSLGNMQLPTPDVRLALIQADLSPQPASIRSQELLSRSPHCDTTGLVLVALPTEQAAPASLLARREQAAFDSLCELVLNPNGTHFLL